MIIDRPDAAKGYLAQISTASLKGALAKGDKVLVIVNARVTGVDEGSLSAKLQLAADPYTEAAATTGIPLTSAWTDFPILFQVETPLPEGKAGLSLFCAQAAQTVEVGSIRVIRYAPDTDVSKFPRIRRTYSGREPDAPWRKAALERIEKIRKADCSLVLTNADGKPLANTRVKLTLRRHEFGFGSATPAGYYVKDTEDGRHFREIIDRLFSIVVFENDLKDMWWGEDTPAQERAARREEMNKAFAWLGERHIAVRGHYLMQVAVPGNVEKMDTETIRRHFLDTTRQRIEFAGNRVCEWDAINHPVAWGGAKLFRQHPGLENLDREVLSLARTLTKLPMFVNEDQLFRPGPQSDGTFDYLVKLKQEGIKVDGLGNQAHVHESHLPSPERMLALTDRFAELVPRQAITEYDLQTTGDEELAADYTRDMLITCFSHPAYTSFLLWGFWEGSHWEPTAASWKKDWTILKRGEVLEEWLG
jgi:GH35 family endo-1,4-beta-xylanase